MSFANTLREAGNFTPGAKGAKNHYTTGSTIINLNNKVIQGSTNTTVKSYFTLAIEEINQNNNPEQLMRLIITIINKRDFRKGGEGCRRIYYRLLLELYNSGYNKFVVDIVKFMPDIGYYNDWSNLVKEINLEAPQSKQTSKEHINYFTHYDPIIKEIARCAFAQIDRDTYAMTNGSKKISLIGKWLGRENKSQDKNIFWYVPLFKTGTDVVKGLYKQGWVNFLTRFRYLNTPLTFGSQVERISGRVHSYYRKSLTTLNRELKTPEVLMCANKYSEIRFENVASKFINRSMAALLNETKQTLTPSHEKTGNRFPEKEDRVKCRGNFMEYLPKMKGAALEFYEILSNVLKTTSISQQVVLRAQWDAKVKEVRKEIGDFREELYSELQKLSSEKRIKCPKKSNWPDIIPLIDCSASMTTRADSNSKTPLTCLHLAVALGMGFADVNEGPFQCLSISYSSTPQLVSLPRSMNLKDRYNRITLINQCSTNYLASQKLIVDYAKKNGVPQEELPETYCFSDEGFDPQIQGIFGGYSNHLGSPDETWKTTYQSIKDIYSRGGYSDVPMTYFHNLSSNNNYGFQGKLDRRGVSMLQGYSSSTFKYAFVGNLPAQVEALRTKREEDIKEVKLVELKKSTNDDFESMINRQHFDLFRCLMHFSNEGLLKDYSFDKIVECKEPELEPLIQQIEGFEIADPEIKPNEEKTWTETFLGKFW